MSEEASKTVKIEYSRKKVSGTSPTHMEPAPPPRKQVSQKALTILGATEEEVRFEKALIMHMRQPSTGQRVYVELPADADMDAIDDTETPKTKVERVLGVNGEPPLTWLKRDSMDRERILRTKALALLGATVDDVRIEKALLVLGEAPGRKVPAGKLPRPIAPQAPVWAVPPPDAEPLPSISVFLLAFLPWGVLAPLNILKLQLNKVSPGAHLWVPAATEQCQAACGVARMWATLFWSLQFASAVAAVYLHYNRERGLALLGVSQKVVVGAILLKAYSQGVIYWPIGLAGGVVEWIFAALYVRELRQA